MRSDDLRPVAYFARRCNDALLGIWSRAQTAGASATSRRVLRNRARQQIPAPRPCDPFWCALPSRPIARRMSPANLAQDRRQSPLLSRSDPFCGSRSDLAHAGSPSRGGETVRIWDGSGRFPPGCSWRAHRMTACRGKNLAWGRAMAPDRRGLPRHGGIGRKVDLHRRLFAASGTGARGMRAARMHS